MNENIKKISREELPNNLSAMVIHAFTSIPLSTVYLHLNTSTEQGGIPIFRIGKSIYSEKEKFLDWWDKIRTQNHPS
ncbi:hypothetical protein D3C75_1151350 [compost metagenome]